MLEIFWGKDNWLRSNLNEYLFLYDWMIDVQYESKVSLQLTDNMAQTINSLRKVSTVFDSLNTYIEDCTHCIGPEYYFSLNTHNVIHWKVKRNYSISF